VISIVVTFYDNRPMLSLCLRQLLPTLRGHDVEVIVVDDNPERRTARAALGPRSIRVIRAPFNGGYSAACNLGADAARGKHLVFLDCDVVVTRRWLDELLGTASRHRRAGGVSAKLLDLSTGAIFAYGASFHGVDTVHPYRGNAADYSLAAEDREFQVISSGTMLIERAFFRRLGGFDPLLRNSFSDFDLAMKMWSAGRTGVVSARAVAFHRGSVAGVARHAHYADTKAQFFKRWGAEIEYGGLRFLTDACRLMRDDGPPPSTPFLAVNLSSTLYWTDYVDAAAAALDVRIIQRYSFGALERNLSHLRLEDHLDWNTCRLRVPILYFVDRFSSVAANYYWFTHRAVTTDVVVDRNGNSARVASLLKQ
jgi:GT2 family glycosyltransferase